MRSKMFLEDLGLKESGLDKLISCKLPASWSHQLSDSGREGDESLDHHQVGTKAPQSSRKDPQSDFERGFIRAEVVNYQDLLDCR